VDQEELLLKHLGLEDIPDAIWELTEVKNISLNSNKLRSISEKIITFTSLTHLDLSHNVFEDFPAPVLSLKQLENLIYIGNNLTILSPEIGNLSNLKELVLDMNKLTKLPNEIGNLTKLERFRVNYNQITTLPETMSKLTSLVDLSMWENKLETFPKSLETLSSLRRLNLEDNPIEYISDEIIKISLKDTNINASVPREVLPNIYIGDFSVACNKKALIASKITHILLLIEGDTPVHEGFEYSQVELEDDEDEEELFNHMPKCHDFLSQAIEKGRICATGNSQAVGAIVTSYIMKQKNLGYKEALEIVRKVNPNLDQSFKEQLEKYEKTILK